MTLEELQAGLVLCIDKPYQWTSFQVVSKVKASLRRHFEIPKRFKIGHAGTLDPLATGVLLVCMGKATKSIDILQQGEKVYTGTMVLGASTPCHDLEQAVSQYHPFAHITPELLDQVRQQFLGDIEQVPPMFSAVKIDGQRAYQLARQGNGDGESLQPTPKRITIHEFQITAFRPGDANVQVESPKAEHEPDEATPKRHLYDHPQGSVPEHLPQIDFRIRCGKGTYIRSIARDFGAALGSGAFLSSLRREQVGDHSISQALQLDQIEDFLQK